MTCEPGTCWAGPLGEACDHWKAEVERLRLQVLALENHGMELTANLAEREEAIANWRDRAERAEMLLNATAPHPKA